MTYFLLFLGGDAKLLVMLCVSPAQRFITETLQCLGFGSRARQVARGQTKKRRPTSFVPNSISLGLSVLCVCGLYYLRSSGPSSFFFGLGFFKPHPNPPPPKKKKRTKGERKGKERGKRGKKKERLIAGFRDLEINSKPSIIHFGDLHI